MKKTTYWIIAFFVAGAVMISLFMYSVVKDFRRSLAIYVFDGEEVTMQLPRGTVLEVIENDNPKDRVTVCTPYTLDENKLKIVGDPTISAPVLDMNEKWKGLLNVSSVGDTIKVTIDYHSVVDKLPELDEDEIASINIDPTPLTIRVPQNMIKDCRLDISRKMILSDLECDSLNVTLRDDMKINNCGIHRLGIGDLSDNDGNYYNLTFDNSVINDLALDMRRVNYNLAGTTHFPCLHVITDDNPHSPYTLNIFSGVTFGNFIREGTCELNLELTVVGPLNLTSSEH